ncbi:uncharacterized protein LOC18447307 [Amborella trichopoda]|uniref:MHD1 domain-containing protein n=1 Tax=Amborella trichopoda TaxID=13333 RepID=U5CZZ6_AMBTC|nr:uncharacterized protein LOC18447307 [Amborella trichopoda]ERN18936.1 hypothetical protein AMTR_s00067p00188350 [Amborella trichopoda]|eukprot:XP_006857469.1 uncharacterized protein LOC18447307 [Amborella trichopoda]
MTAAMGVMKKETRFSIELLHSGSDLQEPEVDYEIGWPFGKVDLGPEDLRETAYEILFAACRPFPGFGGRSPLTYIPQSENTDAGIGSRMGLGLVATSRIKKALGLRTKRTSPKRGGVPNSPTSTARPRQQPFTIAELMRQQMKVSEQGLARLKKALVRIQVGQTRRPEAIFLPLELLRQLRPSEFNDLQEYHLWQRRQLRILEAGLILHPSVPLDRSTPAAQRLRDFVRSADSKPLDTSKSSDSMRVLCNSAVSLAWRNPSSDSCHWADGCPLNLHLYFSLLLSCFDIKEPTLVLDELDEIFDHMKKTWAILAISRPAHNLLFAWALFRQFVCTGQNEHNLLSAALTVLSDVAADARRAVIAGEVAYLRVAASVLACMQIWAERWLLDYHFSFERSPPGLMESVLPLALSAAKILDEELREKTQGDSAGFLVDRYVRASARGAFNRVLQGNALSNMACNGEKGAAEALILLSRETEAVALREKECFSPVLRRWHPASAGVAAAALHGCYRAVLKQYLGGVATLTPEAVQVLQAAGRLEKALVQMAVEDSAEIEDGGKAIIREMMPYEADSVIEDLMRSWVREHLFKLRECLNRAREGETWNPKSKNEPYAQSAAELMKLTKDTVDDFFGIPVVFFDDLAQDLADGIDSVLQDYTSFLSAGGTKHNYIPALPPLTRCNQDSKFHKLWRKALPCHAGHDYRYHRQHSFAAESVNSSNNGNGNGNCGLHPRPSTSRATQRLYIRLNTLHFILSQLQSLDKALFSGRRSKALPHHHRHNRLASPHLGATRNSIHVATLQVSEAAAYRLIFHDSSSVFLEGLYVPDVSNARIRPTLRALKQNLMMLGAIIMEAARPGAVREVMRAAFEAFLIVLLAGGPGRAFARCDFEMVEEDFRALKSLFSSGPDGLAEEVVEKEADTVQAVLPLLGQGSDQLIEDFGVVACEASGLGLAAGQKLPMPPTTGRWNRADPNTILRVLCYRDDVAADRFLKRSFQLPKRR